MYGIYFFPPSPSKNEWIQYLLYSINDSVSFIQYQSFGCLFLLNYLMREIPINNKNSYFGFYLNPAVTLKLMLLPTYLSFIHYKYCFF